MLMRFRRFWNETDRRLFGSRDDDKNLPLTENFALTFAPKLMQQKTFLYQRSNFRSEFLINGPTPLAVDLDEVSTNVVHQ
jgi:hypothetical protein